MKRFLVCTALVFAAAVIGAQQPASSPAETASGAIGGKAIILAYASPRVNGREGKLFGPDGRISQDPHYPVWRGGANAATTLKTDGNIKIGGLSVPSGTYTLFVDISDPDHWKLIVNKQTGEWGLKYDKTQDLGSTPMTMSKPPAMVENLSYTISGSGSKGSLTLAWEDHSASVQLTAQ
jgi:hypothetical protein